MGNSVKYDLDSPSRPEGGGFGPGANLAVFERRVRLKRHVETRERYEHA
jgi:hypothetical protein